LQLWPRFLCCENMEDKQLITRIEKRLSNGLPGREAQLKMAAHTTRKGYLKAPPEANQAGVLALLYPKQAEWHIVLIERGSSNPNDRHRGQISFPGGRYEEQDQYLSNTALREAEEEVGVDAGQVELLGPLTDLYIPVSNFQVAPYVGFTEITPRFVPQEEEVQGILEVPVRELIRPENLKMKDLIIREGFTLKQVPYFHLMNKVVWGATAMMLSELVEVIKR
jgi:8-oxo-dGTP pyrophosphatase MutT (NUDIX family)